MPGKIPDAKTFLTDPAHQADRDFFDAIFDDYVSRRKAEAAAKAPSPKKTLLQTLFDSDDEIPPNPPAPAK